jgi:hypothetical protein
MATPFRGNAVEAYFVELGAMLRTHDSGNGISRAKPSWETGRATTIDAAEPVPSVIKGCG